MFIVPGVTPELSFCLKHWRQMDAISEDRTGVIQKKVGPQLSGVVDKLYERAGVDARDRIVPIRDAISDHLSGTVRIIWSLRNIHVEDNWGVYGSLLRSHGVKHPIGYLGVYFHWDKSPCVILVIWPKGGDYGQKQLVEECRDRWKSPLVTMKSKLTDWPGWEDEPGVVFYKHALDERTSPTELNASVGQASKRFVRVATPVFQKLAAPIR